jgi:diguanylate cyclase (GGDEF)-like protein
MGSREAMGTSGEGPAGDPRGPGAQAELLHESERTRVMRVPVPGHPARVIRKQPLGPDAGKRLRHEEAILERLRGVEGVAQLAAPPPYPDSIMLEDVDGTSLARRAMPLEINELTNLALDLARAVAAMHRRGVVHRDISPANIVLAGHRGTPFLIDFGLATTFAEIRPEFTHHNEIVGTLAYLAPEQTGRTGRPVDQRADLYALGATLYELATGKPPFGTGNPLRLSHDHLARVPVPPAQVNSAVQASLSDIIMHLLEKEPDNRYQSAEGLIHDLELVQIARSDKAGVPFRVGAYDFPLRLLPPSRIVGRDSEIDALDAAFASALTGECRGVLVSGAPGVGKTSLIDELRPIVTASDGWFVAGKFDQYRRDQEFDAVYQAFRSLGRLLLAEPEEELADLRERILRALGPNAGLVTAVVPEFVTLLKVPPDPGDPATAQVRAQRNGVEILRAIASRKRPLVFVVDDLQWAGRTPLGFIDMLLGEEDLDGLLLVGAYREDEVDATHTLAAMMARWRRLQVGPEHLRLENLSAASLAALVADMLHLDVDEAAELADTIAPYTKGNPYDTVELLNSLRHDGALAPREGGWHWDAAALSRRLGQADVADLLTIRVDAMPSRTQTVLETMACLGGRVDLSLLEVATELSAVAVEEWLVPALDDGLLVMEPGGQDAVRFRHDRVQEAVLRHMGPRAQHAMRLKLARRLATRSELFAVAAMQYLPVTDAVRDPQERRQVAELFRRAAGQAKLLSNHQVVERFLAAAVELIDATDTATLIDLQTGRHAALYSLGRLEQADEVYRMIDRLCSSPAQRTDATLVQVSSLTNQGRAQEAVRLGVDLLRQLGLAVPTPGRLRAEIERGLDELYRWVDESDESDDLRRPEITDPSLLAMAALINRLMPPTFFSEPAVMAWLTLEALKMWAEHGPGRTLVGPAGHVAFVTSALRQDYRNGHRVMRRILAVGEARGYEPDTSQARFLYALSSGHWFEPLEENVQQAHRAREGLVQGGDIQNACFTYYPSLYNLLECAPTLVGFLAEADASLAFARRTGNDQAAQIFRAYRRMAQVLREEPVDATADGGPRLDMSAGNAATVANVHITRALTAALLDDPAELDRQAAAAMPLLSAIPSTYPVAVAHVMWALALANRIRASAVGERDALVRDLDAAVDWLAGRAAEAPANFLHLLRLVEAERAWAVDDFRGAAHAFDAAQREIAARQRPWHRALILERAARFHLTYGLEHAGCALLDQARQAYRAWGAVVKVDQLERAHPTLRTGQETRAVRDVDSPLGELPTHRSSIMTGAIDLLGILAASQALSSQTTLEGLRAQVIDVLSAMTGATGVHLMLWNDEERGWFLPLPGDAGAIPVDEAGRQRLVPLSAIRYAERTREPLLVSDAMRDDRFARDPYFASVESCSLLVVPILNQGRLRALLQLENRLIRGAFSPERLDGVMLIAGQLAVSLDNALVYASLERKVAERTDALAVANERLELLSITDPLTGLANRRRLEEVLNDEWRRAQRLAEPIGMAMIDIDHFKLYNDHYGHPAGDDCLQRIAAELKRNIRDVDLVARYGGEEFAIVIPGMDIAAARELGERLRATVVALAEPHTLVPDRIVTVSIGVAAMVPPEASDAEHLVELADVELYRAKHSGRNRVMAAASTSRR